MTGPGSRRGRAPHELQRRHHQAPGDVAPGDLRSSTTWPAVS